MPLSIKTYVLGPLENNTYLVLDEATKEAAVVDPSFNAVRIAEDARDQGWRITQIWLTHAHFDHICGTAGLVNAVDPAPRIFLHPDDLAMYQGGGLADLFGMRFELPEQPLEPLAAGQVLALGESTVQARHTPGHSRGHVVFYAAEAGAVLCGDLIFQGGVGRTDLEGGDQETLFESIAREIMTLPPQTRLLSGHGSETTVGEEMRFNPFLR